MLDPSADGTGLMHEHGVYGRGRMKRVMVAAFGPVADPNGGFGMAILRLGDEVDPQPFAAGDPAVKAEAGFAFEVDPMPKVVRPNES